MRRHFSTITLFLCFALAFAGVVETAFGQRGGLLRPRPQPQPQQQRPTPGPTQPAAQNVPVVQQPPTTRVLIVGVGRFPNAPSLNGLSGCDFDAVALAHGFARTDIPIANIVSRPKDALAGWTKENILDELGKATSGVDDTLIVSLIGKVVQKNGEIYFCAADASDSAVTNQSDETGLIKLSVLAEQAARVKHKALILDIVGTDGFPDLTNWERPKGLWVLTSASAKELPIRERRLLPESRETRSLFGFYMAQGLYGPADLVGNNDGKVSLFEFFNYAAQNTRAHAEISLKNQTAQLLKPDPEVHTRTETRRTNRGTERVTLSETIEAANFSVGNTDDRDVRFVIHALDDHNLRLATADRLALAGNRTVQSLQSDLQKSFEDAEDKTLEAEDIKIDVTDALKRHQHGVSYVLSNFINPALEVDAKNKNALLTRAAVFRGLGDYQQAWEDFDAAGELCELFVTEKKPKLEIESGQTGGVAIRSDDTSDTSRSGNDLTIDSVPVFGDRNGVRTSDIVARLNRGEKVFVNGIKEGDNRVAVKAGTRNFAEDEWIRIRSYPQFSTPVEGWIHRDYVYWSPDAADWYTPTDKLGRMYERNAERAAALAQKFEDEARRLEADANMRETRARRLQRGGAIAGSIIGGDVGNYVHLATTLLAEVARTRAQASRVRAQASRARAVSFWFDYQAWQEAGRQHERTRPKIDEFRQLFYVALFVLDPDDLPFGELSP